jgi:hypothetical protein
VIPSASSVERGEAPLPRVWGWSPNSFVLPHEWGLGGVTAVSGTTLCSQPKGRPVRSGDLILTKENKIAGAYSPPCAWIPAPRFHEDKLRGNDRRQCRDSSLPGSGVSPDLSYLPPRMGARGLKRGFQDTLYDGLDRTPSGPFVVWPIATLDR